MSPIPMGWMDGALMESYQSERIFTLNAATHFAPVQSTDSTDIMVGWLTPKGTAERRIVRYRLDQALPIFLSQSQ